MHLGRKGETKETLLKQLHLSARASVQGLYFVSLSHNSPLLAAALCNHPSLSSITIIYLKAALSVSKCSVCNDAGGGHTCRAALTSVCHLRLNPHAADDCKRLRAIRLDSCAHRVGNIRHDLCTHLHASNQTCKFVKKISANVQSLLRCEDVLINL